MKTLSKEAEQHILDAIATVCEHVNAGLTPTQAVIKVAGDRDFNRNFVRLTIAGYNTGATTYQRQTGQSVLEKMAEFPLAREEEVFEALFPSQILTPVDEKNAAAVSAVYSQRPRAIKSYSKAAMEKAASIALDYPKSEPVPKSAGDPKIAMQKAYGQAEKAKNKLAAVRQKYAEAQEQLLSQLGQFADYFKRADGYRDWSFADVCAAAIQKYGEAGRGVMEYANKRNRTRQAITTQVKSAQAVDWTTEPFAALAACIDLGADVVNLRHAYTEKKAQTDARVEELLRPFVQAPQQTPEPTTSTTTHKKAAAGLLGPLLYGMSRPLGETLMPDSEEALLAKANRTMSDPKYDQEMQAIRARALLQDLMTNDEVIAGYEPEQVIEGYNELAALAPHASTQIAMMRPMLRKWLAQGAMEPFEIQELTNVEKTLNQNHAIASPNLSNQGSVNKDVQRTSSILG